MGFIPGRTKFTVVIPTRERCDTLKSTLKTCVHQKYDNYQILISDNASEDKTKDVIDSIQDARIKYLNTGRRLSMSHNWEFALSHVKDGFVMFLGDDDGLLPDALSELDLIIQDTETKAVNWMTGTYGWPNCGYPWIRNKLKFPVGQRMIWRDAKETLSKVLSSRWGYSELPMLYGFFVDRSCISAATKSNGPFFRSMVPDVYSGVAISGVLDRFLHSYKPFTIYGISQHSTGASFFNTSGSKSGFSMFIEEKNIPFHDKLSFSSSVAILTAESFLQAQDAGINFDPIQLNMEEVVLAAFQEASKLKSPAREATLQALLETCKKNGVRDHVEKKIRRGKSGLFDIVLPQVSLLNLIYKVVFDGQKIGINDINEACVFAKSVLEKRKTGHLFFKERFGFVSYQLMRSLDALTHRNVKKWGY